MTFKEYIAQTPEQVERRGHGSVLVEKDDIKYDHWWHGGRLLTLEMFGENWVYFVHTERGPEYTQSLLTLDADGNPKNPTVFKLKSPYGSAEYHQKPD